MTNDPMTYIDTENKKLILEVGYSTNKIIRRNNILMYFILLALMIVIVVLLLVAFNTGIIGQILRNGVC